MGSLFGKSKKQESRVTEEDKAVLQLKQQRDKLKQYQKRINVQLGKDRATAKQLLKDGKKERAKLLLRKKKFQEGLLVKTDGQLENIERMVHDLEFAQVEAQVIQGLKAGNASLKKMHEILSIDEVERIMDETQEGVEYQQQIDEILAGGLTEQDEEDVLDELEDLIQDVMPAAAENVQVEEDINLPDVPTDRIKEKKQKEKQPTREAVLAS